MSSRIASSRELDALVRDARRDGPTEEQRRALVASVLGAAAAGAGAAGAGTAGAGAAGAEAAGAGTEGRAGAVVADAGTEARTGIRRFLSTKWMVATGVGIAGATAIGLWLAHPKQDHVGKDHIGTSAALPGIHSGAQQTASRPGQPEPLAPQIEQDTIASTSRPEQVQSPPAPMPTPPAPNRVRLEPAPTFPAPQRQHAQQANLPSEASLIESARRALESDPGHALRLVQQHRQLYPSGILQPEREVVEIEALARLGKTPEAQRKANAFRVRNPHSIHEPRIRAALGEATPRNP